MFMYFIQLAKKLRACSSLHAITHVGRDQNGLSWTLILSQFIEIKVNKYFKILSSVQIQTHRLRAEDIIHLLSGSMPASHFSSPTKILFFSI